MVNTGAQLGQVYQTVMPAFSDNADIQQALMMLWYGDANATGPTAKGVEGYLSDLSAKVTAAGAKKTTDIIFAPSAPTRNTTDYSDWIWVDSSQTNPDGVSRPVYIWNGTAWSQIAGAANAASDYTWTGTSTFTKPVTIKGPINTFATTTERSTALAGATNGTLSYINGRYEVLRDGVWTPLATAEKTVESRTASAVTMVEADADKILSFTAATPSTYTINTNQVKVGASIIVHRASAQPLTIQPGAGVTLNTASNVLGRYASTTLTKIGTNEWIMQGSGSSLPSGGSTGQALTKTSGTDYQTAWTSVVPASGGSFTGKVSGPEFDTPNLKVGGSRIFVQSTQPTGMQANDVWIQT